MLVEIFKKIEKININFYNIQEELLLEITLKKDITAPYYSLLKYFFCFKYNDKFIKNFYLLSGIWDYDTYNSYLKAFLFASNFTYLEKESKFLKDIWEKKKNEILDFFKREKTYCWDTDAIMIDTLILIEKKIEIAKFCYVYHILKEKLEKKQIEETNKWAEEKKEKIKIKEDFLPIIFCFLNKIISKKYIKKQSIEIKGEIYEIISLEELLDMYPEIKYWGEFEKTNWFSLYYPMDSKEYNLNFLMYVVSIYFKIHMSEIKHFIIKKEDINKKYALRIFDCLDLTEFFKNV